jgi:LacI family transcriptional regulator
MTRKSITLAEVAQAAGVSPMTASRAINNRSGVSVETRQHVLKIAADLGYVVNRAAQKLSGGRSHIIGVIATGLETEFTGSLLAAISEAAWAAGYETLVYFHVDREKRPSGGVMQMLRQISDGVISVLPLEFGYLGEIASINIPVITIDHRGEHAEFPSIAADCYGGTRAAIKHLIDLGHRRIAFIAGDERLASARERHRAYIDTIAQHGLANDPELVVAGDFTQGCGLLAMRRLLALASPPSAALCANDVTAFGAVAAIRDAGLRVPDDISVVGFDDIPSAAQFYPPLTTVRQPLQQIGRSAVNSLLALIAGIEPASPLVTLPTELILRASTAAPAHRASQS